MNDKLEIDREYFAKILIDAGGLCLYEETPFVSVSGLKEPFFCDHRLLYAIPAYRRAMADGLSQLIINNYELPDVIVGVAIGAIPLATMVAEKLNLPLAYVRPATKDHGRKRLVEGVVPEGSKVVIVEDVIVKATSAIRAYNAVIEKNATVLGFVSIYNQKLDEMNQNLAKIKLNNYSLYDIDVLLEYAKKVGSLSQERYDEIFAWRKDPNNYFDKKLIS